MFDPEAAKAKKDTAALKKKAFEDIKSWIMAALPDDVKSEVETVATREFQCGDPSCAPIDTAIQIFFKDPKRKPLQTGLPKEAHTLTQAEIETAVDMLLTPAPEVCVSMHSGSNCGTMLALFLCLFLLLLFSFLKPLGRAFAFTRSFDSLPHSPYYFKNRCFFSSARSGVLLT
jgi:hypothetical protein